MGTWIVGAIVAVIVVLACHSLFKARKRGAGCSCCDACDGCGVKSAQNAP